MKKIKSKTIFWALIIIGIILAIISQNINNEILSSVSLFLGTSFMLISLFFLVKTGFENIIALIRYWFHKIKGDI
ncbi:hypothetical protein LKF67_1524 [Lactococcus lactis subsp. lactis]|uniref:hypothetical protein n=1 Tax=Lactococcus lactis TaxID=1358 RepID=UPI00071D4393|nr:hypothetical protein [Lactococcus lactis]KST89833.1 hypothetical protein LKF67_1524 [Lactococcus lactis subsp. lactis]